MAIPLTKYGVREMVLATLVLGVLAACGALLFWPAALAPALVWAGVMLFFRDPPRRPGDDDAFLSPADGRVTDVIAVGAEGPLGRPGTRIGVFMSILDVHVNRSPWAGEVTAVEHRDGGHVDARRPEASDCNEAATVLLACRRDEVAFPLAVRQIGGIIARRIVTNLRVGQQVARGERIGMVKFGSRVELTVPAELVGRVVVRRGQTVRAGRTPLIYPPPGPEPT